MSEHEIKSFVEAFFSGLSQHDEPAIRNCWRSDGALCIGGVRREIDFLCKLPTFVGFALKEVVVLDAQESHAAVKIRWEMTMPESRGIHDSYLIIDEAEEQYQIAGMFDYGREE